MAVMEAEQPSATVSCRATTKNGNPCRGKALTHGFCMVHAPGRDFNAAEIGRRGGRKSATVRRARRERAKGRPVTDLLREAFETDEEWLAAAVDAYKTGTREGKPTDRVSVTNDLLARLYGKPQQLVQNKHEVSIVVVSRLDGALEQPRADIELPAGDVIEAE